MYIRPKGSPQSAWQQITAKQWQVLKQQQLANYWEKVEYKDSVIRDHATKLVKVKDRIATTAHEMDKLKHNISFLPPSPMKDYLAAFHAAAMNPLCDMLRYINQQERDDRKAKADSTQLPEAKQSMLPL